MTHSRTTRTITTILFAAAILVPALAHCEPDQAGTANIVPGSKIQPEKLLKYAYQRWQVVTATQFGCANLSVNEADSYTKAEDGVIKERWQAKICNFGRNVWVILTPDGNGNYIVAFGQ